MNTTPEVLTTKNHQNIAAGIAVRVLQIVIGFGLPAVTLFLAAGRSLIDLR